MRYVNRWFLCSLLTFLLGCGLFLGVGLVPSCPSSRVVRPMPKTFLFAPVRALAESILDRPMPNFEQTRELFCSDKRLLPIWRELKRDAYFRDRQPSGDCATLLETKPSDLNGDGTPELLVQGRYELCGATGNCLFWIFSRQGSRYHKILASSYDADVQELGNQLTKGKTKGYRNVLLQGHITAGDTSYQDYRFNGTRYAEHRCLVKSSVMTLEGRYGVVTSTCKEFSKRWR